MANEMSLSVDIQTISTIYIYSYIYIYISFNKLYPSWIKAFPWFAPCHIFQWSPPPRPICIHLVLLPSLLHHLRLFLVWASCQIRKISGCGCTGNAREVFPATAGQRSRHASRHVRDKRAVMHTRIANWRFLLKSVAGKTFPAFPAHAQPAILRIWHEAHGVAPNLEN